jgi:hypothetical protein
VGAGIGFYSWVRRWLWPVAGFRSPNQPSSYRQMKFRQTCPRSFYGGCARETFESAEFWIGFSVCEPSRNCHPFDSQQKGGDSSIE